MPLSGIYLTGLRGEIGEITVPALGISIGDMTGWELRRREESAQGSSGEWTLRAVFSYINAFAFNDPNLRKEIRIALGRPKRGGRQFRLDTTNSQRVHLEGRGLTIEGVSLWPVPSSTPSSSKSR